MTRSLRRPDCPVRLGRQAGLLATLFALVLAPIASAAAAPVSEFPATEFPATEFPATEFPATEFPATAAPATAAPATAAPADERNEELARRVEVWRQQRGAPAMTVAIVGSDDDEPFVRGFDADTDRRFPIGSIGNGFRAAIVAMLVDEGKIGWEQALVEIVPELELNIRSDAGDVAVTWRDVFLHRTGFAGMDRLLENKSASRERILRFHMARAEPVDTFRERSIPNDALMLAVELAIARIESTPFEVVLRDRLLTPLGMTRTTGDRSTAADLAKWVRFLLDKGSVGGRHLVSERSVIAMLEPQTDPESGVRLGLGFGVASWEERTVITQAGSRMNEGRLALLPDSGIGIVALARDLDEPIELFDLEGIWVMLAGEWIEGLGPYVGRYIADFGRFRGAVFTVFVRDDRLMVNVPDEPDYALEWPDDDGLWKYEISDQLAVSFERGDSGLVELMRFHTDGIAFELPRLGSASVLEVDPTRVAKLLGSYRFAEAVRDVRAVISGGRLALDWPDWLIADLIPPELQPGAEPEQAADPAEDDENGGGGGNDGGESDSGSGNGANANASATAATRGTAGHWQWRIAPEMSVTFNEDGDGNIVSLTLYDRDREVRTLTRVSDTPEPGLPGQAELIALRKSDAAAAAWQAAEHVRLLGTVRLPTAGIAGALHWHALAGAGHAWELDYGQFGSLRSSPPATRGAVDLHPASVFGDWRRAFRSMHAIRRGEVDGRPVVYVELAPKGKGGKPQPAAVAAVDTETGDVLLLESSETRFLGGPAVWNFRDWSDVNDAGLRLPRKLEAEDDASGHIVIDIAEITTGVEAFDANREHTLPIPGTSSAALTGIVGTAHTIDRPGYPLELWEKVATDDNTDGSDRDGSGNGGGSSTRPVILLPATESYPARALWDLRLRDYSIMDVLARKGFDVFAIDRMNREIGEGITSGGGATFTRSADIEAVARWLESERGVTRFSIVAANEGAGAAASFAAAYPERVDRLVLHGWPSSASRERPPSSAAPTIVARARHDLDGERVDRDLADELAITVERLLERRFQDPARHGMIVPDPLPAYALRVPTLTIHGQWEFKAPGDLARTEVGARRERHETASKKFFSGIGNRVKQRAVIASAGRHAMLGANRKPWLNLVTEFLEQPIERDIDALAARVVRVLEQQGATEDAPVAVRFRIADGREATVVVPLPAAADGAAAGAANDGAAADGAAAKQALVNLEAKDLPTIDQALAALTLRAMTENGDLAGDTLIATWLGDQPWFDGLPNGKKITLAMLLDHTSGLPQVPTTSASGNQQDDASPVSVAAVLGSEPRTQPGDSATYSHANLDLLRLITRIAIEGTDASYPPPPDRFAELTTRKSAGVRASAYDPASLTTVALHAAEGSAELDDLIEAILDELRRP